MGFLIPITIGLNLYTVAGLLTVVKYEADHKKYQHANNIYTQAVLKMRHYGEPQEKMGKVQAEVGYAQKPLTTRQAAYITLTWPVVLWSSYKIKN